MQAIKIAFDQINQFSKRDLDYQLNPDKFREQIFEIPKLLAFEKKIQDRAQYEIDRELLCAVIKEDYSPYEVSELLQRNISNLEDHRCFTVCTAHQPSLLTGPLYYILKILSTIRLTEILKAEYPIYNFVPVFIHGAEDHDFEEINHLNLFNQKITWNSNQTGSCGRMRKENFSEVLEKVSEILGSSETANELKSKLEVADLNSDTYGKFMFSWVHELFNDFGLVQLNMDNSKLKKQFSKIMEEELLQGFSFDLVNQSIKDLEKLGYTPQAKPRETNLFYLSPGRRDRIVKTGDQFQVNDTQLTFSTAEIKAELKENPQNFSPNVIMRPLYQELILPNLAYVGGGGEIAYWLERKKQFEHCQISFPLLIRRNSAAIIDQKQVDLWQSLDLEINELFTDIDKIKKDLALKNTELPDSLLLSKKKIKEHFDTMQEEIKLLDKGLEKTVLAEYKKVANGLQTIEHKLIKSFKQKEEVSIKRMMKIHSSINPDNSLQERKANFLNYYLRYGKDMFDSLKEHLNPLESDFQLFIFD